MTPEGRLATIEERLEHQVELLREVRSDVKELKDNMNFLKGKLTVAAALIGAVVAAAVSYFTRS